MKKRLLAVVLGFVILTPTYLWVYRSGMSDGVARYKRSPQFELTLQCMYSFGMTDGCTHPSLCVR